MDSESAARFRRADAIVDAALDLPVERRAAFVAVECGTDAELRTEVLQLLRALDRSDAFLATPAAEFAAPFLDASTFPPADLLRPPERIGPFRIEREIGHGGMGTVYLAERDDGQFRQRVALKLVRVAGSDPLVQRFLQERQILAELEHPGIARLLDGGVTPDGAPWFAMEFIEGEPIDRFCASRDLPIAERIRLFREVCAAVEYAHGRHIVHRDLKPGNILVTASGVVKLLDFGVAKLLEGESASGPTTRTTFRAMTPEYAAPEQVRGAAVSSATDVYALGILLYELLVGERPYALHGCSPGEVERIVCATEPVRPSTAARSRSATGRPAAAHTTGAIATGGGGADTHAWRHLRGELDTIVLKALRKEPERRYPSAAALLEDLSRYAEGRPLLARPDSATYRARRYVRRHAAGIVLALAAAGIGVSALYAARTATSARIGGLAADGSVSRVLVADFTSTLDDSVLVRAIVEAVRIDLAQFPGVRVLSPQQVAGTLQRMGRPGELAVNDSIAGELAAREGVAAIVTGEVERVAGRYLIAARLVGAADGELLGAARETVDSTRLLDAVGRVTRRLRRDLGEGARSLRTSPALPQVTTASLPALRAYTEGIRHNEVLGDRQEAVRLLQSAVAMDPGFASAHRILGSLHRATADHASATAAFQRAFDNRERLPVRERYLTMGSHYLNVTHEYDKAIDAYLAQIAREPTDRAALNNLSLVYRELRDFANQEALLLRVIAIDTTLPPVYLGLSEALAHQSRFDEAHAVLDEMDRRFPDHPITPMTRAYVSAAQQDWVGAERHIRRRLEESRASGRTHDLMDAHQTLGQVLLTTGRVDEAERELRTALAIAAELDAPRRLLFTAVQLGWLELRHRQQPARALALLDSVLATRPLEQVHSMDRPYAELSGFYAGIGDAARVRALLDLAQRDTAARADLEGAAGHMMRGFDALLSGRAADAVAAFGRRQHSDRCTNCGLPMLGLAYEQMGDTRSAIAAFERYLETPWIWRFETDAPWLAATMQRLVDLYERDGREGDAEGMRARLQRLRRDAGASN
jgi:eukaryotic-like serine/threonine-protein kinase